MRFLGRLAVVVLVVAAASALWWLDTLRNHRPEPAVGPQARHEPDYYFDDFRLRAYAHTGSPVYVLSGERLVHFADDGTAQVVEPRLLYDSGAGAPWHARGRRGILGPKGDVVRLEQNVRIRREPAERPPVLLRTAQVTIYTDAGRAATDRPVTITSPGQRVTAMGMTVLFDLGLIELHEDVRGTYDPSSAR